MQNFAGSLLHQTNKEKSAAISYAPPEPGNPTWASSVLCHQNSWYNSIKTHWGHQSFTRDKGTNVLLTQGNPGGCPKPTGYIGGYFSTDSSLVVLAV